MGSDARNRPTFAASADPSPETDDRWEIILDPFLLYPQAPGSLGQIRKQCNEDKQRYRWLKSASRKIMTGDRGLTRLLENGVVGVPHRLKSPRQINR